MEKRLPFAATKNSNELWREVIVLLVRELNERLTKHVPAENHQTFYHGRHWTIQREDRSGYSPQTGVLEPTAAEVSLETRRVLANDIKVLPDFIRVLADDLERKFLNGMFAEIATTAQASGNTISLARAGSLADAFLEMARTVDLSVDATGNINTPTLHLPADMMDRLRREVEMRGPALAAEFERVRAQKEQEAIQRETERLGRYDVSE